MNTKDLKCFQAVYEERSVSRAARRLFITPQGLSKNIRQLEEELHAVLFVRTSHGMAPTESGRFLYERSGRVIRQLEEIENGLRQLEQRRERIRIGCANGALNLLGNDAGSIRSTDTGGQNQYFVAHAHTAVRPLISIKSHVCPPILFLLPRHT